jgi:replicative DNA helicase
MRSLSRRARENKVIEIGEITAGLKDIAKELRIPVFACAQLNRETEKRPMGFPQLSDLRESGSMENDADTVILLWRPIKHCKTSDERLKFAKKLNIEGDNDDESLANLENYAEAILAKQRNGPTGRVQLRFDGERTLFQSMTDKKLSNREDERQEILK